MYLILNKFKVNGNEAVTGFPFIEIHFRREKLSIILYHFGFLLLFMPVFFNILLHTSTSYPNQIPLFFYFLKYYLWINYWSCGEANIPNAGDHLPDSFLFALAR
jgi:hypothetical protein